MAAYWTVDGILFDDQDDRRDYQKENPGHGPVRRFETKREAETFLRSSSGMLTGTPAPAPAPAPPSMFAPSFRQPSGDAPPSGGFAPTDFSRIRDDQGRINPIWTQLLASFGRSSLLETQGELLQRVAELAAQGRPAAG